MYRQEVVIRYTDGTEATVSLTQWSLNKFGQFATGRGWSFDPQSPGLLGITMLRYQAWAEIHRDPSRPQMSWDKWDALVDEVAGAGDPEEVPPTEPAPTEG